MTKSDLDLEGFVEELKAANEELKAANDALSAELGACRVKAQQAEELNTKVLWLEHKLAQLKKGHAAMIDGLLS